MQPAKTVLFDQGINRTGEARNGQQRTGQVKGGP
jgi:hypothetical protein